MATDNEQGAFGALDADEGLTREALALLALTDPVKAVHLIASEGDTESELRTSEIINEAEAFDSTYRNRAPFLGYYLTVADEEGGYEGGGEYVERVIGIHNGDKTKCVSFVRITGHYESYNGTEYDDEMKQVWPHQVTVTQYKEWE
jgi:hypothetical protein